MNKPLTPVAENTGKAEFVELMEEMWQVLSGELITVLLPRDVRLRIRRVLGK